MKRRTVLSSIAGGSGALLAGCLGDGTMASNPNGNSHNDDGGSNETNGADGTGGAGPDDPYEICEGDGKCGPAVQSVADQLLEDPERVAAESNGPCFDGARPSVVVENARAESIVATIVVDESAHEETVELDPGGRAVTTSAFEAKSGREVTVTVEGKSETASWAARSCYRHAVVVEPDGLTAGWIVPLQGPGDTQHDCYAGDPIPLTVRNDGRRRHVDVSVFDRCSETEREESLELGDDDFERLRDRLEAGGVYDVTVEPEDGTATTYEFRGECWGVSAHVDEDGSVELRSKEID